jgi:hypothetical protein
MVATMPTVLDVLGTYLLGDEVAAQLKLTLATKIAIPANDFTHLDRIKPNSACRNVVQVDQSVAGLEGLLTLILGVGLTVGKAIQYVAQLPPSPGYEPFLVEAGWNPIAARGMAKLAVRHGKRNAKESKWRRPVFDAIRLLAEPHRQRRAVLRCAKLLLQASKETSIIETIFYETAVSEFEFIRLLESAVEGNLVEYSRITEIAVIVSPRLSLSRGPKISAPSAAHEFLLGPDIGNSAKRRPSTHQNRPGEYVDALTEATRREFDVPDFDSRPAGRRLKARQKTNPAPKR